MAPPCLKEHFRTIKLNQTQSNAAATRSSLKADFTQNFSACEKREEKKKDKSTVRVTVTWAPRFSIFCKYRAIAAFENTVQFDSISKFRRHRFEFSEWFGISDHHACSERGNWHYHQWTYLLTYYLDLIFFKVAMHQVHPDCPWSHIIHNRIQYAYYSGIELIHKQIYTVIIRVRELWISLGFVCLKDVDRLEMTDFRLWVLCICRDRFIITHSL